MIRSIAITLFFSIVYILNYIAEDNDYDDIEL